MSTRAKPPTWFWVVAILLLLWEAAGCYACYSQIGLGPAAWGPVDDWASAYYAALPVWYNSVYIVATFGGLLGAAAMLGRNRAAVLLFWLSEIAVFVMFGYTFAATDLIAHKGATAVLPFPIVIAAIGAFAIWFASLSVKKGWIGR